MLLPLLVAHRSEQAGVVMLAVTNLPSHFAAGRPRLLPFRSIRPALRLHLGYALRRAAEYALFEQRQSYLFSAALAGDSGFPG